MVSGSLMAFVSGVVEVKQKESLVEDIKCLEDVW
jgi:hypothetical protein